MSWQLNRNQHPRGRSRRARAVLPFGFDSDGSRASIAEFDYEGVFRRLDGEIAEADDGGGDPPPLIQILSPRELQHAYALAQCFLKKSSPQARALRASWRDPVWRERRTAAIRRAATKPEVGRRRSEYLRRYWQTRDPQQRREFMRKVRSSSREKWLANLRIALRNPGYRSGNAERARARWANPAFRQKVLAILRGPEARSKASLAAKRYFHEHPEARLRAAERMRALRRVPTFRKRRHAPLSFTPPSAAQATAPYLASTCSLSFPE
jgi:hypothetical protein